MASGIFGNNTDQIIEELEPRVRATVIRAPEITPANLRNLLQSTRPQLLLISQFEKLFNRGGAQNAHMEGIIRSYMDGTMIVHMHRDHTTTEFDGSLIVTASSRKRVDPGILDRMEKYYLNL